MLGSRQQQVWVPLDMPLPPLLAGCLGACQALAWSVQACWLAGAADRSYWEDKCPRDWVPGATALQHGELSSHLWHGGMTSPAPVSRGAPSSSHSCTVMSFMQTVVLASCHTATASRCLGGQVLERVLAGLEQQCNAGLDMPALATVRLSGLVHADERTAFQDIARQLCGWVTSCLPVLGLWALQSCGGSCVYKLPSRDPQIRNSDRAASSQHDHKSGIPCRVASAVQGRGPAATMSPGPFCPSRMAIVQPAPRPCLASFAPWPWTARCMQAEQ